MERQACTASAITFKEPHPVSPLMYLLFPLLGLVAGILAGLLGVGGGLVLVAALAWLLPLFGVPPEVAMHAALASSLASIVLTAASSARAHARRGSVLWPTVAWMVPGLLLGAWLGSGVAVKLDAQTLRWIVAGYCLLAAWQTGFGRSRAPADATARSALLLDWAGQGTDAEVPDPYTGGSREFDQVWAMVEAAARAIVARFADRGRIDA